jgi:hypothetical protein
MRARQPQGGQTLLARAIAAIRRNNGSLFYVPANFAGAWTDSAGTDPVDAVADVLGLMTDRSYGGATGPELVTNGGPSFVNTTGWLVGAGTGTAPTLAVTSGRLRIAFAATYSFGFAYTSATTQIGKWYSVIVQVGFVSGTNSGLYLQKSDDGGNAVNAVGSSSLAGPAKTLSLTFQATATTSFIRIINTGAANAVFDVTSASCTEIFGAVATQATTANKPTVQTNAQGGYVVRFDGSNDNLATNLTCGNEGWICAGVLQTSQATSQTVMAVAGGTAAVPGVWFFYSSAANAWRMRISNGTTTTDAQITAGGLTAHVVSAGWTASGSFAGMNTTETETVSRTGDCSSGATTGFIGALGGTSNFFAGNISAIVYCPVLPNALDRMRIRRWIGSLQGQTL